MPRSGFAFCVDAVVTEPQRGLAEQLAEGILADLRKCARMPLPLERDRGVIREHAQSVFKKVSLGQCG